MFFDLVSGFKKQTINAKRRINIILSNFSQILGKIVHV